ncbi:MAG: hypothetical protein AAF750_06765 [Planctomycetota bacterium]
MPAKARNSKRKTASKTTAKNRTAPPPLPADASALESLVGGVQERFSDLVNWHQKQAKALEAHKAQVQKEQDATRAKLDREQTAQERTRTDIDKRNAALKAKEQAVAAREKAANTERKTLDADLKKLDTERDALAKAQQELEAARESVNTERAELKELAANLHREHEELRVQWDTAHAVRRAQDQLFELVETERQRVDQHLQRLIQSTGTTGIDNPPLTLHRPDHEAQDPTAPANAA